MIVWLLKSYIINVNIGVISVILSYFFNIWLFLFIENFYV